MGYQVYMCTLPEFRASEWQDIVTRLRALGHCQDNAYGITTVRRPWGYFQIPPRGFPELKVTLFRFTRAAERQELLDAIADALRPEAGRT